jgi:hypothetical protein
VTDSAISPARWAVLGLEPSVVECRTCGRRYTLSEFLRLLFVALVPQEDGWVLGEARLCHCTARLILAVACMVERPMHKAGDFTECRSLPVGGKAVRAWL